MTYGKNLILDFITVDRVTGEKLASAMVGHLESWDLNIANCRGQAYDGAANMSSSRTGVQARIAAISPPAFYTHCQSHKFNLCVIKKAVLSPLFGIPTL